MLGFEWLLSCIIRNDGYKIIERTGGGNIYIQLVKRHQWYTETQPYAKQDTTARSHKTPHVGYCDNANENLQNK